MVFLSFFHLLACPLEINLHEGIAYDPRLGVTVDERLRTSNPRVYAAGDICFPYKFKSDRSHVVL